MRTRLFILLTLPLGALLQQLLPAWPVFAGMKPPILAMMAFYYALRRNSADTWLAIFAAALLQDGLDLGSMGPALIAFPAIGMVAIRIRSEIFSDGLITQLFFGAAIGLFTACVTLVIYSATGQRALPFGTALLRLFISTLLGMATLPLISITLKHIEAALPQRRRYGWQ